MRRIYLRNSIHREAFIDDEDHEKCKGRRWFIRWNPQTKHYNAYTPVCLPNRTYRQVPLHRLIANARPHEQVTFVNQNHLDCQKRNLIIAGRPLLGWERRPLVLTWRTNSTPQT